jgi:hypothetical protein
MHTTFGEQSVDEHGVLVECGFFLKGVRQGATARALAARQGLTYTNTFEKVL